MAECLSKRVSGLGSMGRAVAAAVASPCKTRCRAAAVAQPDCSRHGRSWPGLPVRSEQSGWIWGFSLLGWRTGASHIMLHASKRGEMSGEAPFSQFPFAKAGGSFQPLPTPAMADTLTIAAGCVIEAGRSPPSPPLHWLEGCSSPWQSLCSAHNAFPGSATKRDFNWCPLGCRAGPLPCRAARNKCCDKRDSGAHGERDGLDDRLPARLAPLARGVADTLSSPARDGGTRRGEAPSPPWSSHGCQNN